MVGGEGSYFAEVCRGIGIRRPPWPDWSLHPLTCPLQAIAVCRGKDDLVLGPANCAARRTVPTERRHIDSGCSRQPGGTDISVVTRAPADGRTRAGPRGSGASWAARATTHPPNPAPVRRAPKTPGARERSLAVLSKRGVDTSKSVLKLSWLSAMSAPALWASPVNNASVNARTRPISLTTCLARRRTTGSVIPLTSGQRRRGPTTWAALCGRVKLQRLSAKRAATHNPEPATSMTTSSGIATGSTLVSWQSISNA